MLARLIKPNSALAHASKQLLVRQPYRCLSYHNSISSLTNRNAIYLSKSVFLNNNITVRQLHTSNNRRNDDDDKKNKKDDKKKDEAKPESVHLSAGVIGALVVFALGVAPFIYESTSEAAMTEVTFKKFTDMARTNKIKSITHNESLRTLYIDTSEGKVKLPGLDYNMAVSRLEQIYDAMQLHPADRIMITRDQGGSAGDIARKFWDVVISPTTLMIFFFSLMWFPNFRNRIMQGMKLNMNQNKVAENTAKNIKGKKGKKKKENNSGGMFGMMNQQQEMMNKQIGEIIEPGDIKNGFAEVAGCEEAKIEVIEIVDFLRNEKKYKDMGAKVPKGAILHGPPGTGKTLLAKACAKEAGVTFLSCNGSEFVEMFVGLGAKRVREMFEQAREHSPCILFIDELDAVGKKRGQGMGGGNQEMEQTINAFLAELDGFKTDEPVVVMAATNQVDKLDDALTRPGRFDRKIYVGLPDVKGRSSIFNVHLGRIKTDADKSQLAKDLATKTPGMSGADIDNVVNEAALNAVRYGDKDVQMQNFERAIDRVIAGMEKKNDIMDKDTKLRVARHEAGHATVAWFLKHCAPLVKVTIVPRTEGALGFAMYQPVDNQLQTDQHLKDAMSMTLGGRAAEEVFYDGVVSTGAHDDLKKVATSAYMMVSRLGMSQKLYNVNVEDLHQTLAQQSGGMRTSYPSEATKQNIDNEIQSLINDQYARTVKLIEDKKDLVEALAQKLMEKETIGRDDVVAVLGPRPHAEKYTYDELVKDTKQREEDLSLPPGLKHWEKSFKNSDKFKDSQKVEEEKTKQAKKAEADKRYKLPDGWKKKYDPNAGTYYLNDEQHLTTLRHPGKPLPDGWRKHVDDEGREKYVHDVTGFESWILEDDPDLPTELAKELGLKK